MSDNPHVRTLPLFNSHQLALISPIDFDRASRYVWSLVKGRVVSTCTTSGRKVGVIHLARLVTRAPRGTLIDHKNNQPCDCTRGNLRPATHQQNARNRRKAHSRSRHVYQSQYIGVRLHPKRTSYEAFLTMGDREVIVGRFVHEVDAARARDRAARRAFGPFAKLNFPEEKEVRR